MGGKDNSLFEKKNGPVYRTRWAFSEQLSGWTGKPMEYSPPLVAIDARQVDGYHGARVAPVAQLDRVLPSEGRGRGFESRLVHHRIQGFEPTLPDSQNVRDSRVTATDIQKPRYGLPCGAFLSVSLMEMSDGLKYLSMVGSWIERSDNPTSERSGLVATNVDRRKV